MTAWLMQPIGVPLYLLIVMGMLIFALGVRP